MVPLKIKSREGVDEPFVDDAGAVMASLNAIGAKARAKGRPNLVELAAKNGNTLSLALGADETVIIFGGKKRKPRYCHSLGTPGSKSPDFVCWSLGKHEMAIPRRLVIPIDGGMRAVEEFLAKGERPASIPWEEAVD